MKNRSKMITKDGALKKVFDYGAGCRRKISNHERKRTEMMLVYSKMYKGTW